MDTDSILSSLIERHHSLKDCRQDILDTFLAIANSYKNGGKLLICGNGGSASDADHISGELLKGFTLKRPLDDKLQKKLGPSLASKLQGSLAAIPLANLMSLNTAYNNDCDPEYTFAQLTFGLGKPEDILLGISTSGNSKNIINAINTAKALGIKTIGLTGKLGGELKKIADVTISVPADEVYHIQELHLPIYHSLCILLEHHFFKA